MIHKPITLYTQNLITSSSQIQTNSNTLQITFSDSTQADAILLKNTKIVSMQIEYKTSPEQETWTQGPLLTQSQKEDKFFIFTSQITAKIFKFTFDRAVDFQSVSLVKKLLSLENILSSFTLDNTFKGDSYYLSDGSLICWQEYSKKRINLNLTNISQTLLEDLKNILKTNSFLTYSLFGDFDGYFTGEFALKESPSFQLNRQNALYSVNLILLER